MVDQVEPGIKPFLPENLPNPIVYSVAEAISVPEVPLPNSAETKKYNPQDRSYAFINELKRATETPEGFIPSLDQANKYTLDVLQAAYPERDFTSKDTPDQVMAQTHTRIMRKWMEDMKTGKTSPEMVSLFGLMSIEQLRASYEAYIQKVGGWHFKTEYGSGSWYDAHIAKLLTPEGMKGREMEERFFNRAIHPSESSPTKINDGDIFLMKLLGHYRSFVLAEEVQHSARDNRPVSKNLVKDLWEANNFRSQTIKVLISSSPATIPDAA